MGFYDYLMQSAELILASLPQLTAAYSKENITELRRLGSTVHAAVLLTALDMPPDNPGSKRIIEFPCGIVHHFEKVGMDAREVLRIQGYETAHLDTYATAHVNTYGSFLVSRDEQLLDEVAPIFAVNKKNDPINYKLAQAFRFPECCVPPYDNGSLSVSSNKTVYQFLHDHFPCSDSCEGTKKIIESRRDYLKEHKPDLYQLVQLVMDNFSKGVYLNCPGHVWPPVGNYSGSNNFFDGPSGCEFVGHSFSIRSMELAAVKM